MGFRYHTDKITVRINYKDIVKGNNLSMDMQLQANDTIIVP